METLLTLNDVVEHLASDQSRNATVLAVDLPEFGDWLRPAEVVHAQSGRHALELLQVLQADLLLTPCRLGDVSIEEFARRLGDRWPRQRWGVIEDESMSLGEERLIRQLPVIGIFESPAVMPSRANTADKTRNAERERILFGNKVNYPNLKGARSMSKSRKVTRYVAPLLMLACAKPAVAAIVPITTLYNTGVETNNSTTGVPATLVSTLGPFPSGNPDPHWTITTVPTGGPATPFSAQVVETNDGDDVEGTFPNYPIGSNGPWELDSDTLSEWIAPHADEGDVGNEPASTTMYYTYQTTFSLAGLNPSTVSIAGTYIEDDILISVSLNGTSLGISQGGGNVTGLGNVKFTIPVGSNFTAGTNTLDFVVENYPIVGSGNNPTGLRVEMSGSGVAVPEPIGASVMALGLFGLLRRRRKAAEAK